MSQAASPPPIPHPGHGIRARSRFLIQSIRLEEKGPPGALSMAMVLISFLLVASVVWASLTTVDEVATATGEVVPKSVYQQKANVQAASSAPSWFARATWSRPTSP